VTPDHLQQQAHRRRSSFCWVFSLATHGVLVSAALALVAEITLPPPPETFKWDVALVQAPAPPEEPVATPPPPMQPPPPPPQPVRAPTPKKIQPVKTEPVVRAPQPVQEQRPLETVQPVEDVVPLLTAQPIQQVMQQQVEPVTHPVQEEIQPSPEVTQTVTRTDTPVETKEAVEQQSVTAQPIVTAAVSSVAPPVTEQRVVEESSGPVETPQQVEQTVTARAAPDVQQRAAVQHLSVRSRPATKPDYGWLSQALWSTVEQRKRYPQEARRNRWEGKVILKLTIEQRGAAIHLLDVTLEESSGHTVLDRHTLDMVRKAFPLDVKHVLAQQQIQLHLPFSYRME
jgi:protein TonB